MSNSSAISDPPLGATLQQAGLISRKQLEEALAEQRQSPRRIGEILAAHGWIRQESADFFAERWPQVRRDVVQRKIGQYLRQAGLLTDTQIELILAEQKQRGLRFGTLAILKGWVRYQTIEFFLKHEEAWVDAAEPFEVTHFTDAPNTPSPQQRVVDPFALLQLYQQILQSGAVPSDGSPEQAELLNVGLAFIEDNRLKRTVDAEQDFPPGYVHEQLQRPYDGIRLKLLNLDTCSARPYQVLTEVFTWTGNQPELTQKLCQLIRETGSFIAAGEEPARVAALVQDHFIQNWESSPAAAPLRKLRDRLLGSRSAQKLLQFYSNLLRRHEIIALGSPEEKELLQLGLIAKDGRTLHVANKIYRFAFNSQWVTHIAQSIEQTVEPQTESVRPQALLAAVNDEVDESSPLQRRGTAVLLGLCAAVAALIGITQWQQQRQLSPIGGAPATLPTRPVDPVPSQLSPQLAKKSPSGPSQQKKPVAASDLFSRKAPTSVAQQPLKPASEPTQASAAGEWQSPSGVSSNHSVNETGSGPAVVSTAFSAQPIPIFRVGSTQAQLIKSLGPPTWNRQGYYPNSRALLYKGLVSKHVDFGYLLDDTTGRLRQTEMAFDQSVSLEVIQKSLSQLFQPPLPADVQKQLSNIYQYRRTQYAFTLRHCQGEIHRDQKGWIYVGVWDADFH